MKSMLTFYFDNYGIVLNVNFKINIKAVTHRKI